MRLPMKKNVFFVAAFCFATGALAQDAPSVQDISKAVVRASSQYANAVSCETEKIGPKQIAGLRPYKSFDDRMDAVYAVLWSGDIGCAGGSGTSGTNISIVTIGAGDSYVVDPTRSSPVVQFESPVRYVERIVGNTPDTLILEGKDYGPKDPNCCPSVPVRFTLKVDGKGNWKLVEKKVMPVKK